MNKTWSTRVDLYKVCLCMPLNLKCFSLCHVCFINASDAGQYKWVEATSWGCLGFVKLRFIFLKLCDVILSRYYSHSVVWYTLSCLRGHLTELCQQYPFQKEHSVFIAKEMERIKWMAAHIILYRLVNVYAYRTILFVLFSQCRWTPVWHPNVSKHNENEKMICVCVHMLTFQYFFNVRI